MWLPYLYMRTSSPEYTWSPEAPATVYMTVYAHLVAGICMLAMDFGRRICPRMRTWTPKSACASMGSVIQLRVCYYYVDPKACT
jgi:hypothetical protein